MKKSEIIDLLNRDLTGEIEEILIYNEGQFYYAPMQAELTHILSMKKRNILKNLPNS